MVNHKEISVFSQKYSTIPTRAGGYILLYAFAYNRMLLNCMLFLNSSLFISSFFNLMKW